MPLGAESHVVTACLQLHGAGPEDRHKGVASGTDDQTEMFKLQLYAANYPFNSCRS